MAEAMTKVILIVLAFNHFRDEEYRVPRQTLEKAGYQVLVASNQKGKATGMLGMRIEVDRLIEETTASGFDGLILVGGSGTPALYENSKLHKLIKEFITQKKPVGAICLAPVILARAGVLKGKKATVYASASAEVKKGGANYSPEPVVVDGQIVTADGPEAALDFARTFLNLLSAPGETR
ncbi:MAG: DJ-1/PfpI family protein [Candidatus Omnitrophica bacterium]|nr:DJ-1/PfpI family protein [Candidatus Omnitrophota bacterium]